MFALLVDGLGAGLAFQNELAILVQLQFGDDHLGRVNANMYGGSIGLFTLYALNVNGELASVALQDFAGLLTFVVTSSDLANTEYRVKKENSEANSYVYDLP